MKKLLKYRQKRNTRCFLFNKMELIYLLFYLDIQTLRF
jgi:hypothetical protein